LQPLPEISNRFYKVRELLGAALPKTAIEEARLDFRKAYDLTQRWDKALELLNKLRWQIAFDAQTYLEYLRPGVKDKKLKGYFNKLLEAGITIKPPAPIPELLASKSELKRSKAQLKAAVPRHSLTGSQVKEYRIARGWSQGQLALYAGLKGKSLISRIESGQRTITPNMEAMFRQLLDIPD
jgi:DNA-binding XRE family transcriptional regulator